MNARVSVIGHFGEGVSLLNGQTLKTRIITDELQKQLGDDQVRKIDTHGGKKTLLKAPFQAFGALKSTKNVLIFPAQNGLRVYAPLLSFLNGFFKKKLHYVVIGGWLPQFLDGKKHLVESLKRFDGIYVETETMKSALEHRGFENVFVLPNCKKLTTLSESELVYPASPPYKLCTFSRVMREKGIEDAVDAVKAVNSELGYTAFELNIFGQIDKNQTEWFESLQNGFPNFIRYGGQIPFDKSVEVLKDHFALIFPTYYEGEGFAGTLIDAYSAGVPIIATDWKYNSEFVNETVGCLYPTRSIDALVDILKGIATSPQAWLSKKPMCLKTAKQYEPAEAIAELLRNLE